MKLINEYLINNTKFNTLLSNNQKKICGTNENSNIAVANILYELSKGSVLFVVPTLYEASKYFDILNSILPEGTVLFYPADELITAELYVSSDEFKIERINTIYNLISNTDKKYLVITSYSGLIKKQFSIDHFKNSILKFETNKLYNFKNLTKKIAYLGYKKVYQVEKIGDFAIKGSIIDIFPFNSSHPVRFDFFGDYLEQIKKFNISTQRSFENLKEFNLFPYSEMFFTEDMFNQGISNFKNFINTKKLSEQELSRYNDDLDNLIEFNNLDIMTRYISFFSDDLINISNFDFEKKIIVDEERLNNQEVKLINDLQNFSEGINGYSIFDLNYFYYLKNLDFSEYYLIEGITSKSSDYYNLNTQTVNNYTKNFNQFLHDLEDYHNAKTVILLLNEKRIKPLKELLKEKAIYPRINKIEKNKINIITESYTSFELPKENIILISEQNIYKSFDIKKKINYKSVKDTKKINSVEELKPGDYIVHYDHGIGRYLGIVTLELSGKYRDYLHIQYAKEDKLYIPIEQLDLITKYSKSEAHIPKLNDLSTSNWKKTKEKIRNKLLDISEKLIEIYANRQASIGFACDKKHTLEYELESDFEFQETPDQLKEMKNIERDMESIKPMDRLICADVGYGKTELALRASFKAILNNKQVVYLAPTTILSKQHYNTFKNRLEKFGVRVELLNRYTTGQKLKELLEDLKKGYIDCLIGTHRVLSKDIVFKDLGLLVIDEEQRFGVLHKERIKEMKINVDTLTLSATPIPRTLQMSLMGIKDLSIINTPPANRYPVQTYVLERHNTVIREAIEKELVRNGQVFYLYNKVEDIENIKDKLQSLVPQAKICIAHGQMPKQQLESTIEEFIDRKYDILLCTTIIETGIDIPNTNTLIIHDSDRLGLSQLYQIRGRVGRSDRIGYAYLMFDKHKILTEQSQKRLESIKEFTELGSGFKIAMRDLDIRGAGDILGSEQSGFIDSVGIDLYLKMLEEAINIKKGKETTINPSNNEIGEVLSNRTINNQYINNDELKIEIHRKITNLKSLEDLSQLKNELEDRFGKIDDELEFYMQEKLFKHFTSEIGTDKIVNNNLLIKVIFSRKYSDSIIPDRLFFYANKISNLFHFDYKEKRLEISLDKLKLKYKWIKLFNELLEFMLKEKNNK